LTICGTKRSTVAASTETIPLSISSQFQVSSVSAGAAPTSASLPLGAASKARLSPAASGRRISKDHRPAHLPEVEIAEHRRCRRAGDAERSKLRARVAQLALRTQDEHRETLERRGEHAGGAGEQELVGRRAPDDEGRLQPPLGRAEAGQARGAGVEAGDVAGELALQECGRVGATGANHATIGEAANAADRDLGRHAPLSSGAMVSSGAGLVR
jgi:hypothetical protein